MGSREISRGFLEKFLENSLEKFLEEFLWGPREIPSKIPRPFRENSERIPRKSAQNFYGVSREFLWNSRAFLENPHPMGSRKIPREILGNSDGGS